jgi:hypothetical protein
MDELDQYECFGIPTHVWEAPADSVLVPPQAAVIRSTVYEAALLGAEAIPSPALP